MSKHTQASDNALTALYSGPRQRYHLRQRTEDRQLPACHEHLPVTVTLLHGYCAKTHILTALT